MINLHLDWSWLILDFDLAHDEKLINKYSLGESEFILTLTQMKHNTEQISSTASSGPCPTIP